MSIVDQPRPVRMASTGLGLRVAVAVGSILLLCALYGRIMGYDLRRDEFMFLPPAALLGEHRLYTDLFYNHVPYSAWLFRAVHLVLPDIGLVMAGRLTVFAAWLMLLSVAGWLGWRLTRSALVAGFCVLSLLTADVLLGQTGMAATNNLLPMPFVLLGVGLLTVCLIERNLSFVPLFAAGMMLSVAAGLKVSAFAVIPPVAIGCFLLPRELPFARRARLVALPVALGGLLAALPLIWSALSMPQTFFAHILGYHLGPHVAYWEANAGTEPDLAMGLGGKLRLSQTVWLSGTTLLALFVVLLALVLRTGRVPRVAVMAVAAILCTVLMGFAPDPGFPQYYAMPLIGLPLMMAILCACQGTMPKTQMAPVLALASVVMLALALPRLAVGLNDLRHPDNLTPARVMQGADALRDAMTQAGLADAGPVATLSPLYPLEAGLPIYPEFAAGPFAYRVAAFTSADLRARYVMAGPRDLEALFARMPPAAILTGFDQALDGPLIDYARDHGYRAVELAALRDRYGSGTAWLQPGAPDMSVSQGED